MRTPFVAGNWKMNGNLQLVNEIVEGFTDNAIQGVDVVIAPPACLIGAFPNSTAFEVAGQNMSEHESGAHTGDISAAMLKEQNCKWVIVGHSERRADHGESNELVALKAKKAIQAGLFPIICIGEPLEIREENTHERYVGEQLKPVFSQLSCEELSRSILAYEPVWAIGTGKTASPDQAQSMHAFIRATIAEACDNATANRTRVLYGGSVKADNAKSLFEQPDIDGGLIGGASLSFQDFSTICQAATNEA